MNYKKNNTDLTKRFWKNSYKNNATGWDIGCISTPIKEYINQLKNKNLKILIPGAGNSYEAEYLFKKGFTNLTILDFAKQPLVNFSKRVPNFPKEKLIKQNFFKHTNRYDLIIEQTFFCALHPTQRKKYADRMSKLLNPKGKLVGLLFDFDLTEEGPPFGGSLKEYVHLFSKQFTLKILEKSYNSIKPRNDRELFFIFEKK